MIFFPGAVRALPTQRTHSALVPDRAEFGVFIIVAATSSFVFLLITRDTPNPSDNPLD